MRTDLSPAVEFDWVEVELYRSSNTSGAPDRASPVVPSSRIEDAVAGVRIAELEDLSPGSWRVVVRLMRSAPGGGLEVVSGLRDVLIRSSERRAVTVLITRDCVGVMCPGDGDDPTHLACLGGRCVDPRCAPETPETCPPPECGADGECAPAAGLPACATGVCLGGVCGTWPDNARCAAGQYCAFDGCVRHECAADGDCVPTAGLPACATGLCLGGVCASWPDDARCGPAEVCTFDGCVPREVPATDAGVDAGIPADAGPRDAGPGASDPCFEALGSTCEVLAGSTLKASNTGAEDRFGVSVSLSGDTLAVAAYLEDSDATGVDGDQSNDNAADSGAVYVFVRDGAGTWTQQAYLKASNTGAGDRFGRSVSLDGDTLAVGAWGEDSDATGVDGPDNNNATDSDAVYVFVRDGSGVWSQQAYLKASNTGADDQFGGRVSLSSGTLAVGAWLEDGDATGVDGPDNDNATDSGAVYLFDARSPPRDRTLGEPCRGAGDCMSGYCGGGACTDGALARACEAGGDCASGYCGGGACTDGGVGASCGIDADCQAYCVGTQCDTGAAGAACVDNADCVSGNCRGNSTCQ